MRGLRSRTPLYNFLYVFLKPFYFLLKNLKSAVTNTDAIGQAMINVTLHDYYKNILDPGDINKLASMELLIMRIRIKELDSLKIPVRK